MGPFFSRPGSHDTEIRVWSTATARTMVGSDCGDPCSAVIITRLCSEYSSISRYADRINATRNCECVWNKSKINTFNVRSLQWNRFTQCIDRMNKVKTKTENIAGRWLFLLCYLLVFIEAHTQKRAYPIFCIRLKVLNAYRWIIFHALITAILPIVAALLVTPLHQIISQNVSTLLDERGQPFGYLPFQR